MSATGSSVANSWGDYSRLRLVDVRRPITRSPFVHGENLGEWRSQAATIQHLGEQLSRPLGSSNRDAVYLASQFVCERWKSRGYAGVVYPSQLESGFNVVLFEPEHAFCTRVREHEVTAVTVKFKPVARWLGGSG